MPNGVSDSGESAAGRKSEADILVGSDSDPDTVVGLHKDVASIRLMEASPKSPSRCSTPQTQQSQAPCSPRDVSMTEDDMQPAVRAMIRKLIEYQKAAVDDHAGTSGAMSSDGAARFELTPPRRSFPMAATFGDVLPEASRLESLLKSWMDLGELKDSLTDPRSKRKLTETLRKLTEDELEAASWLCNSYSSSAVAFAATYALQYDA